jgi:transcriptional regulator with XRE-family HTH domain
MSVSERVAQSPERMKRFQAARLEMEITELLCELMENQGVSRAELARRLGTTPPYVTKVLRGQTNMTLKTISDWCFALGRSVRIIDRPLDVHSPRLLVLEIGSNAKTGRAKVEYQFTMPTSAGITEDDCRHEGQRQDEEA